MKQKVRLQTLIDGRDRMARMRERNKAMVGRTPCRTHADVCGVIRYTALFKRTLDRAVKEKTYERTARLILDEFYWGVS